MFDHWAELQRAYVFRVVDGIRMVGLMGGDGVLVMIDTGNDFRYLLTVDDGVFHSCGGAAGSAEKVNIQ